MHTLLAYYLPPSHLIVLALILCSSLLIIMPTYRIRLFCASTYGIMLMAIILIKTLSPAPPTALRPKTIDRVLVLGGGSTSVSRLIQGVKIANEYQAILYFTGNKSETVIATTFLNNISFDQHRVVIVLPSKNTYENFKTFLPYYHPNKTYVLVTSPLHLSRALAVAHHFNMSFIPAYNPSETVTKLHIPTLLGQLDSAAREVIGKYWYQWHHYIS